MRESKGAVLRVTARNVTRCEKMPVDNQSFNIEPPSFTAPHVFLPPSCQLLPEKDGVGIGLVEPLHTCTGKKKTALFSHVNSQVWLLWEVPKLLLVTPARPGQRSLRILGGAGHWRPNDWRGVKPTWATTRRHTTRSVRHS